MKEKLKKLRKKRGLSQAEVAHEIGISRQMYNKYERGDTEPSLSVIKSLCTLYSVSYDELLDSENSSEVTGDSSLYEIKESEDLTVCDSAAAYGTENYYAKIISLLPHLLLSEKSRLLSEVADSITSEVEGRKSQPLKVDQSKTYFPTHEEYEKGLNELLEFTEKIDFKTNGVKWTREEMHER